MSLRSKLAAKNDVKTVAVPVEEWGETVYVRTISNAERQKLDELSRKLQEEGREVDGIAWMVILTACEQNGERIWSDADFEHVNNKSATALDTIVKAAMALNGLDAGAVDAAKKN